MSLCVWKYWNKIKSESGNGCRNRRTFFYCNSWPISGNAERSAVMNVALNAGIVMWARHRLADRRVSMWVGFCVGVSVRAFGWAECCEGSFKFEYVCARVGNQSTWIHITYSYTRLPKCPFAHICYTQGAYTLYISYIFVSIFLYVKVQYLKKL